jgi:hypothetical protein
MNTHNDRIMDEQEQEIERLRTVLAGVEKELDDARAECRDLGKQLEQAYAMLDSIQSGGGE